jgi:hypothetical protein
MSDELSDEPIELSEKPISSLANEIHLYTTCVLAHPRVTPLRRLFVVISTAGGGGAVYEIGL